MTDLKGPIMDCTYVLVINEIVNKEPERIYPTYTYLSHINNRY